MTINRALIPLFSFALFTSAALMFSVQPMVGKLLLPIVGGTPAGWIVAMAFFQLALLVGYGLAYALSRLTPRQHGIGYLVLLLGGVLFLPVTIQSTDHETLGAWGTFAILSIAVGFPFVALSTTSTTLQRLFGATGHPAASDPYFLYAASNLGSFAGLLLYPFLIEPALTLGAQTLNWKYVYLALIALAAVCVFTLRSSNVSAASETIETTPAAPIPLTQKLYWLALAFIPASLLMGYTSFITRDIYSAPMIWVLPLSLYLLTFVITFRTSPIVKSDRLTAWHLLSVMASMMLITLMENKLRTSMITIVFHLSAFMLIALGFHARLFENRPKDSNRHLAVFYLMLSVGGALAGLFNAFLAPVLFNQSLELPLVLLLSLFFHPAFSRSPNSAERFLQRFGFAGSVVFLILWQLELMQQEHLMGLAFLCIALTALHPRTLMFSGALFLLINLNSKSLDIIDRTRNFYGNLVVYERYIKDTDTGQAYLTRHLKHGTTMHGFQIDDLEYRLKPVSYYGVIAPLFEDLAPKRTAVMGLGAGVMNCFGSEENEMTFIEIDPAVVDFAQKYFTYLSSCGNTEEMPRILLGDGRLEMQKLEGEKFDMIVMDVFSSDYIPAHLMTREAINLYLDRLSENGVILVHISNIFFNLEPPLAAIADELGLSVMALNNVTAEKFYHNASLWIAMARTPQDLERFPQHGWEAVSRKEGTKPWTDDYSDFIGALRRNPLAVLTKKQTSPPTLEKGSTQTDAEKN